MKSFLVIVLLLMSSSAFSKDSVVYQLKINESHCSVVLTKKNNKCHLITNAHCFKKSTDKGIISPSEIHELNIDQSILNLRHNFIDSPEFHSVNLSLNPQIIQYEKQFFGKMTSKEIELSAKFIDRTKDLAELIYDDNQFSSECSNLTNLSEDEQNLVGQNILLVGFTRENTTKLPKAKVWYTRNTIYLHGMLTPSFSPENIQEVTSGLSDVSKYYLLSKFPSRPGMSGGALIDSDGNLIGITNSYHPTQDKTYTIPKRDLLRFLDNPRNSTLVSNLPKHLFLTGDNSGVGTGDNSGVGTGDNSGVGTGDNSGVGTGDNSGVGTEDNSMKCTKGDNSGTGTGDNSGTGTEDKSTKCTGDNSGTGTDDEITRLIMSENLQIFIEPLEGITFGSYQVLLAIGNNQIDGYDNYKDHQTTMAQSLVLRSKDNYLNKSIRENLISRLSGQYEFDSTLKNYTKDEKQFIGWDLNYSGDTKANVQLNHDSLEISFASHQNVYNFGTAYPFTARYRQEKNISFNVEFQNDNKTIFLRNNIETLVCDNLNYLKLICKGKRSSFSLSLDKLDKETAKASFRYYERIEPSLNLDYYYGSSESNE
jgi:hypothetical protein